MSVHQLKDGRWIIAIQKGTLQDDPERTRIYFGRGLEAERQAREKDRELQTRPWVRRTPKAQSHSFSDLVHEYLEAKRGTMPKVSRENLMRKMTSVILPELGHLMAIHITPIRMDRYVNTRLETTVKVSIGAGRYKQILDPETGEPRRIKKTTVHREISDIKAVLSWAADEKRRYLARNPLANYEMPARDDEIILPPTKTEVDRILAHAPEHLVRALSISYYTGLRPGAVELFRLRWTDIDWDESIILIRSAQKGGPRMRLVPIHKAFLAQLQKWHAQDTSPDPDADAQATAPQHIIHYRGKPIKKMKTAFETAKRKAGITRRIRPYDFRHAFASHLLRDGADLKGTSEILGHSRTDTTTKIYQHTDLELHRKIIDRLPALNLAGSPSEEE